MKQARPLPDWLPYVAPMAVFLAITAGLEGRFEEQYPLIYIGKVLLVAVVLWLCRGTWKDYKWETKHIPLAVVVGLAIFVLWVAIEKVVPYPHLGDRTGYNPFEKIPDQGMRMGFLAARFFGLVLLVPFLEELFWRSFLVRFATKPDFLSLAVGEFSTNGMLVGAGLFGAAHPEWIPAVITGLAYTELLRRTKSLSTCFVAHAVTNLALGVYVVTQHDWKFW